MFLPWGTDTPLSERENLGGTHPRVPRGFTCVTMGRMWRNEMENLLQFYLHEYVNYRGILPRRVLPQFPVGNHLRRTAKLILLLVLLKRFPKHLHKMQVIPLRIRGVLPPTRWSRGTAGFIGLYGADGLASWRRGAYLYFLCNRDLHSMYWKMSTRMNPQFAFT